MGSTQTFQPTWITIKKPSNYPTIPTAGKLQLIWETNSKSLYHKLSPYTDYEISLTSKLLGDKEPFYYTFPDQNKQGLNAVRQYDSRTLPLGSALIDVVRVTKFLGSGRGILFLGKQFLLQTGNVYNETRIYNPTSPIVASGMALGLGSIRPNRNFDTSAGLAGIATSLLGSLGSSIFGKSAINPPAGTTGVDALPTVNVKTGGKGLLRAGTANSAKANLNSAWGEQKKSKGFFSSLFANFISETQSGITYRSDEGAYGLMILDKSSKLSWTDNTGRIYPLSQRWIGGGNIMRKNGEYANNAAGYFTTFTKGLRQTVGYTNSQINSLYVKTIGTVGYTVNQSNNNSTPGYRYGDNLGVNVNPDFEASNILVQYKEFATPSETFPTKQTNIQSDITPASQLNSTLKAVIDTLNKNSGGLYSITVPNDARVISSGQPSKNGYDRLFSTVNKTFSRSGLNYPMGVLQDYRESKVIDNSLTMDVKRSKKFSGAGNFDAINTLNVLGKDMKIPSSKLKGWNTWSPYEDDQIAFYFYDVVNERYIPFRAAITGLSQASNASWEEMPFIGRADKVYSYGGFNRNASFTIKIVISSIAELAPTWQRINYLTTLVKPANYTTSNYDGVMNRFMIPPMVMMTIGDLYKEQPILIQSITTTVPDDAIWETQNEFNSQQWEYLATYMKSPNVLYGQLPREVDISLGVVLLEKERAIVGGADFGHAPRTDDLLNWNTSTVPSNNTPNKLNQSLVVDNTSQQFTIQQRSQFNEALNNITI